MQFVTDVYPNRVAIFCDYKKSLDKSRQLNNTLNMPETAQIDRKNIDSGQITDLNLTIANMKMSGMRNIDISREMGISNSAVCQHLKRFKDLVSIDGEKNTDPINNHRVRLQRNFKKIEQVYDHVFKPGSKRGTKLEKDYRPGWNNDHERLKLAVSTGLTLDKGLGVLVEHSEGTQTINYEDKRQQVIVNLGLAEQFGASIPQEIRAEIVDNSGETGDKQRDNDGQAVVPDSDVKNVSRADKSTPPDIPPAT